MPSTRRGPNPAAIASTSSGVARSDWGNADYKSTSTGSRPDRTDAQDGWASQQWGSGWGDLTSGRSDPSGDNQDKDTVGNGGWGDGGGGTGWGNGEGDGWGTSEGMVWGNEDKSLKSGGGKSLESNENTGWGTSDGNGWENEGNSLKSGRGKGLENNGNTGWGTSDGNGWGTGETDGSRRDSVQDGDISSRSTTRKKETIKSSPLPNTEPSGSHLPLLMKTPNTPRASLEIRTAPLEDPVEPNPTATPPTSAGPSRGSLTWTQVYSSTIRYVLQHLR